MPPRTQMTVVAALAGLALAAGCGNPTEVASPPNTTTASRASGPAAAANGATVVVGSFTITDLGVPTGGTYSSGYTINNLGQVAGMSSSATGALSPLLWTGGTFVVIPNFDPASLLIPVRLNDAGHMILQENIGNGNYSYAVWREPNGTLHSLPTHPGGDPIRVFGRGINASGLIVGMTREPALAITTHGVIWQNGAFVRDLGAMSGYQSTSPQDINDIGQVVGMSTNTTNFNNTAFLWQNGAFTNLGALMPGAASMAMAINNTGTIVGTSNGGFPVRWVNGQIQTLPVPNGVIQPTPVDVNDGGDIVGWGTSLTSGALYASVFWRAGKATLLPPWPGATQTMARSINNNGEIVGEGNIVPGGPMHALLWRIGGGNPPPPVNTTPIVTLTATSATTINAGGTVTMRGDFIDPDNGAWRYKFQWGNSNTSGSMTAPGAITASHRYNSRGTYRVTLTVTDAKGATGTSNVISVVVR